METIDIYAAWRDQIGRQSGAIKDDVKKPTYLPTLYQAGHYDNPQPGIWRKRQGRNGPFVPVKIMLVDERTGGTKHAWSGGLVLKCVVGMDATADAETEWPWCRSHAVSQDDYRYWMEHGRWIADPPPLKPSVPEASPSDGEREKVAAPHGGPGHNSGDLDAFQRMRLDLMGDCSEARVALTKPIATSADADRLTDWSQRIAKMAKAAEASRRAEQKPHEDAVAEIRRRYQIIIGEAESVVRSMQVKCNEWLATEQAKQRKIAEAEAQARIDSQRAERAKAEAERAQMERNDPVAAMTGSLPELPPVPPVAVAVVAPVPKIMLGSGTVAPRRSLREAPATAVITDLGAAAAYYAAQRHPDLIALIQKLADKAAKAKAEVPGCMMSWQNNPNEQRGAAE